MHFSVRLSCNFDFNIIRAHLSPKSAQKTPVPQFLNMVALYIDSRVHSQDNKLKCKSDPSTTRKFLWRHPTCSTQSDSCLFHFTWCTILSFSLLLWFIICRSNCSFRQVSDFEFFTFLFRWFTLRLFSSYSWESDWVGWALEMEESYFSGYVIRFFTLQSLRDLLARPISLLFKALLSFKTVKEASKSNHSKQHWFSLMLNILQPFD